MPVQPDGGTRRIVWMIPLGLIARMRQLPSSRTSTVPSGATVIPTAGKPVNSSAESLAGPPSPENPRRPLPANTDRTPSGFNSRIWSRELSRISRLPFGSVASAVGWIRSGERVGTNTCAASAEEPGEPEPFDGPRLTPGGGPEATRKPPAAERIASTAS